MPQTIPSTVQKMQFRSQKIQEYCMHVNVNISYMPVCKYNLQISFTIGWWQCWNNAVNKLRQATIPKINAMLWLQFNWPIGIHVNLLIKWLLNTFTLYNVDQQIHSSCLRLICRALKYYTECYLECLVNIFTIEKL